MKFDKVRAFWGRKLLTVLLVPTILGCHFTAVQALADEAVVESGETTADSGEDSKEDQNNNDNQPAADDNQGNQGGESDDNSGDGNDNSGESSGEDSDGGSDGSGDAEDASSAGATTSEDAGGEASGSASTGASSDNAGTASSSEATSGNSSDASTSASSGASTDAAADASSGASSADAADAVSSASSEDASGEAKDVSGNDAETAELLDSSEVFNDDLEVYFIYNYKEVCGEIKLDSTDIYYSENVVTLRSFSLETRVNGLTIIPELYEQEKKYNHYFINCAAKDISFTVKQLDEQGRQIGDDYYKEIKAEYGKNIDKLYPMSVSISGYTANSEGQFFVNSNDIKEYDDLQYVVEGITALDGTFELFSSTNGENFTLTERLSDKEPKGLKPFQPQKYVFSVLPKPEE
ncbi:MAG: hypothetical protein IKR11_00940, partial [Solobacterium sp.]|nr:hypothetical protein [Solobacterium sp.]